ncbi:hypothetical protein LBMAG42_11220 [Deltaproteobacteria bacterium]|nr:hypothetical protein LBMAG42_11220 [Deltaproteobacteria bacterium]
MLSLLFFSAAFAEPLTAKAVANVPAHELYASDWGSAGEVEISVLPQQVASPRNMAPTITKLKARALADKNWVSIRLQWDDKAKNDSVQVDEFTDAVAIEFPLGDPAMANPMMGGANNPVYIAHWKAIWQRDVEDGHTDVQDYHPNFWSDGYPFVKGGWPYPVETAFSGSDSMRYLPGTNAGNPISQLDRYRPVEELTAVGYGTLATQQYQDADAWGEWKNGVWTVIISVPRVVVDAGNPTFETGNQNIAFAVWDGGAENVGGRKHWFPFTPMVVQ